MSPVKKSATSALKAQVQKSTGAKKSSNDVRDLLAGASKKKTEEKPVETKKITVPLGAMKKKVELPAKVEVAPSVDILGEIKSLFGAVAEILQEIITKQDALSAEVAELKEMLASATGEPAQQEEGAEEEEAASEGEDEAFTEAKEMVANFFKEQNAKIEEFEKAGVLDVIQNLLNSMGNNSNAEEIYEALSQ